VRFLGGVACTFLTRSIDLTNSLRCFSVIHNLSVATPD
jgi:hypothetical protein